MLSRASLIVSNGRADSEVFLCVLVAESPSGLYPGCRQDTDEADFSKTTRKRMMNVINNDLFESAAMVDSLGGIVNFIAEAPDTGDEYEKRVALMTMALPQTFVIELHDSALEDLDGQDGWAEVPEDRKEIALFGTFLKGLWEATRDTVEWNLDMFVGVGFVLHESGWKKFLSTEEGKNCVSAVASFAFETRH